MVDETDNKAAGYRRQSHVDVWSTANVLRQYAHHPVVLSAAISEAWKQIGPSSPTRRGLALGL